MSHAPRDARAADTAEAAPDTGAPRPVRRDVPTLRGAAGPGRRALLATSAATFAIGALLGGCGSPAPATLDTASASSTPPPTPTSLATPTPTPAPAPAPATSRAAGLPTTAGVTLPWPAANPTEATTLQSSVDSGSEPWLLDPTEVAMSYVAAAHGWDDAQAQARSGGTTIEVRQSGRTVVLSLSQPARAGTGGIWVVTAEKSAG